jgi:hypothetical protein
VGYSLLIIAPPETLTACVEEIGAHLVQTVITRYTSLSTSAISSTVLSDQAGKQPLNLLVLLSELYNFQVISCRIIYDIIRELIEGMSEKSAEAGEFSVEALLKILRCECRLYGRMAVQWLIGRYGQVRDRN